MSNRMQELIALLEEEIEQSPKPRLGNGNKRVVDCDRLLDILGDMKVVLPEEVRLAQTVLNERENLLAEADEQAVAILAEARMEAERMIARDEIIMQAKQHANSILDRAEENAVAITNGARSYSQEILEDVQRYLHEYIDIVNRNRGELTGHYQPMRQAARFNTENADVESDLLVGDNAAKQKADAPTDLPDELASEFANEEMDALENAEAEALERDADPYDDIDDRDDETIDSDEFRAWEEIALPKRDR